MNFFSDNQNYIKNKSIASISFISISFIFILLFTVIYTNVGHAEKLKPLWTPEDFVGLPFIDVNDVYSQGDYTLMHIAKFPSKGEKGKQKNKIRAVY